METSNSVPVSLLRELRASRVVCNLSVCRKGGHRTRPLRQKALAVALSAPRAKSLIVWLGKG